MGKLLVTFLFVLFCDVSFCQEEPIPDYSQVCECLSDAKEGMTEEEITEKAQQCILLTSGPDKEKFFDVLGYVFYYCPKFPNMAAEIEFKRKEFDTIPFEPISEEQCKNLYIGKWTQLGADEGSFGYRKDSIITQYINHEVQAEWQLVEEKGCVSKFLVLENVAEFQIPPLKGDYFVLKTIGIYEDLVLTELTMGNLRFRSVGTPYKE